jgi:hypothetical protein
MPMSGRRTLAYLSIFVYVASGYVNCQFSLVIHIVGRAERLGALSHALVSARTWIHGEVSHVVSWRSCLAAAVRAP